MNATGFSVITEPSLRLYSFLPVLMLGLFASPLALAAPVAFAGSLAFADTRSLNWSGYAVAASTGSVTVASGSWIQPSVTCSGGTSYASFWVGIDGFNSNTVEQAGTLGQCSGGVASYSAWYEFYPAASVTISSITVHPGDNFSSTISYSTSTGQFTLTITDVTTGNTYSKTGTVSGAQRSSAECIAERPSIGGSITKLARFGTVSFSQCSATISGVSGAFGNFSGVQSIDMVSRSGKLLAQTSVLGTDNASFMVTWKASN